MSAMTQFADAPEPQPRGIFADDPEHVQLPDEDHELYVEGRLALLRFVRGLEATHRNGFLSVERMRLMFPERKVKPKNAHRCELPVSVMEAWQTFDCPECSRRWASPRLSMHWTPTREEK